MQKSTPIDYSGIRTDAGHAGIVLSDDEFDSIVRYCNRKIEINHLGVGYMELLLPDEIRHYAMRRAINGISMCMFNI